MKYGRNQWARISSLLVRKTPKQCKARWNEWLDPRIRKTEWTRDEDERLLHLAKVFPSQWGTISDMIGRTAQMCLERYEQLLDKVAAVNAIEENAYTSKEGEEGVNNGDIPPNSKQPTTTTTTTTTATTTFPLTTPTITKTSSTTATLAEARKLRPGERDPNPEGRAARPDPVDMDEEEKEMLAEARARLANTQGKKQKRKAREKMLEEARRAAAIQKRKELIAAGLPGISFKNKHKKGMDYNEEIPFEHTPLPGLHETREELAEEEEDTIAARREKRVRVLTKEAEELAARRKDVEKEKTRIAKGFLPATLERRLRQQQAARRQPISLPTPLMDEGELEMVAKYGEDLLLTGGISSGRAGLEAGTPGTSYSVNFATPFRRAPGGQTPLISSAMSVAETSTISLYSQAQYGKTPIRDPLGINRANMGEDIDPQAALKSRLRRAFNSLPSPKNGFDLVFDPPG